MSKSRDLRIVLGLILALGAPLSAGADNHWTAPGATASMDETALNPILFTKSTVGLSRAAGVTSSVIAYWTVENVDAVTTPTWDTLSLTNYDNSLVNYIHLQLLCMNLSTGGVSTIATVVSTNSASTKWESTNFTHTFDFVNNAYFIYAYIYGADTSSQPIIRTVTVRD